MFCVRLISLSKVAFLLAISSCLEILVLALSLVLSSRSLKSFNNLSYWSLLSLRLCSRLLFSLVSLFNSMLKMFLSWSISFCLITYSSPFTFSLYWMISLRVTLVSWITYTFLVLYSLMSAQSCLMKVVSIWFLEFSLALASFSRLSQFLVRSFSNSNCFSLSQSSPLISVSSLLSCPLILLISVSASFNRLCSFEYTSSKCSNFFLFSVLSLFISSSKWLISVFLSSICLFRISNSAFFPNIAVWRSLNLISAQFSISFIEVVRFLTSSSFIASMSRIFLLSWPTTCSLSRLVLCTVSSASLKDFTRMLFSSLCLAIWLFRSLTLSSYWFQILVNSCLDLAWFSSCSRWSLSMVLKSSCSWSLWISNILSWRCLISSWSSFTMASCCFTNLLSASNNWAISSFFTLMVSFRCSISFINRFLEVSVMFTNSLFLSLLFSWFSLLISVTLVLQDSLRPVISVCRAFTWSLSLLISVSLSLLILESLALVASSVRDCWEICSLSSETSLFSLFSTSLCFDFSCSICLKNCCSAFSLSEELSWLDFSMSFSCLLLASSSYPLVLESRFTFPARVSSNSWNLCLNSSQSTPFLPRFLSNSSFSNVSYWFSLTNNSYLISKSSAFCSLNLIRLNSSCLWLRS